MLLMLVRPWRFVAAASVLVMSVSCVLPSWAEEVFEAPTPSATDSDSAESVAGRTPFFIWGPIAFRPYVSYRYDYGDGLRARPGDTVKSGRHRISPGTQMHLGRKWVADYSPAWTYYTSDEFRDTVDHFFSARGNIAYEEWAILPSYRFSRNSPVLIETAEQTAQKQHNINLTVVRRLSDAFSTDLTLNQNLRYAAKAPDVRDRSVTPRVRYHFADPLSIYAGMTFGRTNVQNSPNMKYSQPTAGVTWRVTGKTTADVYAGWERRTFEGLDLTQSTPLFGAALTLRPFEFTTVSLDASKQVSPSYFFGQTRESTQWSLSLNQRLLGRLWLGAGLTRQDADYASTYQGLAIVRRDDRDSWHVRLGTDFHTGGRIAISYRESDNTSNLVDYTYSSSQISVEASYRF